MCPAVRTRTGTEPMLSEQGEENLVKELEGDDQRNRSDISEAKTQR